MKEEVKGKINYILWQKSNEYGGKRRRSGANVTVLKGQKASNIYNRIMA